MHIMYVDLAGEYAYYLDYWGEGREGVRNLDVHFVNCGTKAVALPYMIDINTH